MYEYNIKQTKKIVINNIQAIGVVIVRRNENGFFQKVTALMTSCVFVVSSSTIAFAKATDRIVYQQNTVV